jgi:hypothetical protein
MSEKSIINIREGVVIQCNGCPTKFIPKYGEYAVKEESETSQDGIWVKHFILGFECPTCRTENEIGYWGGVKNKL